MPARLASALALGLILTGCTVKSKLSSRGEDPEPTGALLFRTADELKPHGDPGTTSQLVLAGTKMPVDLKRDFAGKALTLTLGAHGEVFEVERYELAKDAFLILEGAGESYKPGLPVLKFPAHSGETWQWIGSMTTGGVARAAKATVTVDEQPVMPEQPATPALRSVVRLEIDANDGGKPAKRELTLYFVPGKGIVKREFGAASIRQPLSP